MASDRTTWTGMLQKPKKPGQTHGLWSSRRWPAVMERTQQFLWSWGCVWGNECYTDLFKSKSKRMEAKIVQHLLRLLCLLVRLLGGEGFSGWQEARSLPVDHRCPILQWEAASELLFQPVWQTFLNHINVFFISSKKCHLFFHFCAHAHVCTFSSELSHFMSLSWKELSTPFHTQTSTHRRSPFLNIPGAFSASLPWTPWEWGMYHLAYLGLQKKSQTELNIKRKAAASAIG